ncbi:MAG: phosphatase PAP2 family protein [Candidatus Adlerbacteria bacterium]|nr:phosphatase PAP2 family protein [Candidatus Adlerbacteria bacterium]
MSTALIIFCAQYLIWVAVAVSLGYLFYARKRTKRKMLLLSLIALPAAYIVAKIAGIFYVNPRPFIADGVVPLFTHVASNGFPSSHMLFGATLATIVLMFNRPVGILLFVMAVVVGVARVLAGVHHYIDIIGAGVIAFFVVFIVYRSIRAARWYRG